MRRWEGNTHRHTHRHKQTVQSDGGTDPRPISCVTWYEVEVVEEPGGTVMPSLCSAETSKTSALPLNAMTPATQQRRQAVSGV